MKPFLGHRLFWGGTGNYDQVCATAKRDLDFKANLRDDFKLYRDLAFRRKKGSV